MAATDRRAGEGSAVVRIATDDRDRAKARTLRRDRDWDAAGAADVSLPAPLTERALATLGYRAAAHGGWVGPDGERYGSLDEAARTEFTALALAACGRRADPVEEALVEIGEIATIPIGEALLSPDERIRGLAMKLRHVRAIAAAAEPRKYWRPRDGRADRRFGGNVDRLRRERGLSTDALAARSKIDPGDLEKIARGDQPTSLAAVLSLAGALGVPVGDLVEGIDWVPDAEGGSGGWEIAGGGQDG